MISLGNMSQFVLHLSRSTLANDSFETIFLFLQVAKMRAARYEIKCLH